MNGKTASLACYRTMSDALIIAYWNSRLLCDSQSDCANPNWKFQKKQSNITRTKTNSLASSIWRKKRRQLYFHMKISKFYTTLENKLTNWTLNWDLIKFGMNYSKTNSFSKQYGEIKEQDTYNFIFN